MDKKLPEIELSQLARTLFDQASNHWYIGVLLEVLVGFFAAFISITQIGDNSFLFLAIFSTLFLIVAFYLRYQSEKEYSNAETMRRQSVLSEALGWPINRVQRTIWRSMVSHRLLTKIELEQREPDYFETKLPVGANKLREMTIQSAFFTRMLYAYQVKILNWVLAISIVVTTGVIFIALTSIVSVQADLVIAKFILAMIPLVLSINLIGWRRKFVDGASSIKQIEESLEALENISDIELPIILRWVSEYNCEVVTGIPIHKVIFKHYHNAIQHLWKSR